MRFTAAFDKVDLNDAKKLLEDLSRTCQNGNSDAYHVEKSPNHEHCDD